MPQPGHMPGVMEYGNTDGTRDSPTIPRTSSCTLLSGLRSVRPHCVHMPATNDFRPSPGLSRCDTPRTLRPVPGASLRHRDVRILSFARYLSASRLNFLIWPIPHLSGLGPRIHGGFLQYLPRGPSRIRSPPGRNGSSSHASSPCAQDPCSPPSAPRYSPAFNRSLPPRRGTSHHLSGRARRARERLDQDVDQPTQAPHLGADQLRRFGFWRCRGTSSPLRHTARLVKHNRKFGKIARTGRSP